MIPFILNYTIEETLAAMPTKEQAILKNLTGLKLSGKEAGYLYERVQDHKWYLGERLKRDVGLRVAAVDYVENFYEPRQTNRNLPRQTQRFLQPNLTATL